MSDVAVVFTGDEVAIILAKEAAEQMKLQGRYDIALETHIKPTMNGIIKIVVTLKPTEDRSE